MIKRECQDGKCVDCRIGAEIAACVEMLKHASREGVREALVKNMRVLLNILTDENGVRAEYAKDVDRLLEESANLRAILKKESKRRKI